MSINSATVPLMSPNAENGSIPSGYELIDASELAARWRMPESWIRNHTRQRTPKMERIPCIRLGRYVRFEWGSPWLEEWLNKRRR